MRKSLMRAISHCHEVSTEPTDTEQAWSNLNQLCDCLNREAIRLQQGVEDGECFELDNMGQFWFEDGTGHRIRIAAVDTLEKMQIQNVLLWSPAYQSLEELIVER